MRDFIALIAIIVLIAKGSDMLEAAIGTTGMIILAMPQTWLVLLPIVLPIVAVVAHVCIRLGLMR